MTTMPPVTHSQRLSQTSPLFREAPIGVLDSGVGGLSILRELQQLLPQENFVFFADQGHVPYGEKTLSQVREFASGITRFFLSLEAFGPSFRLPAKLVVIACNAASAAALHYLRESFPQVKFVGMEPAIKPAAQRTRTGVIGVIATKATFQGELYASLVDRFAQGIEVQTRACPELVMLAERGGPFDESDLSTVRDALKPLVRAGIDQLVLGCTHFPFLEPLIRQSLLDLNAQVEIVDPSAAVALQTERVLKTANALSVDKTVGRTIYLTSSDGHRLQQQIQELLGQQNPEVYAVQWQAERPTLK